MPREYYIVRVPEGALPVYDLGDSPRAVVFSTDSAPQLSTRPRLHVPLVEVANHVDVSLTDISVQGISAFDRAMSRAVIAYQDHFYASVVEMEGLFGSTDGCFTVLVRSEPQCLSADDPMRRTVGIASWMRVGFVLSQWPLSRYHEPHQGGIWNTPRVTNRVQDGPSDRVFRNSLRTHAGRAAMATAIEPYFSRHWQGQAGIEPGPEVFERARQVAIHNADMRRVQALQEADRVAKEKQEAREREVENKTWYVYIVRCADGTLYTGVAIDVGRRLRQHNGDIKGGAKYTSSRRPVLLLRTWDYPNRSTAQRREAQIKKMTRKQKLALVYEGKMSRLNMITDH